MHQTRRMRALHPSASTATGKHLHCQLLIMHRPHACAAEMLWQTYHQAIPHLLLAAVTVVQKAAHMHRLCRVLLVIGSQGDPTRPSRHLIDALMAAAAISRNALALRYCRQEHEAAQEQRQAAVCTRSGNCVVWCMCSFLQRAPVQLTFTRTTS